ncbi:unnamed protein product, partial [Mesorhabditis spiculigera]
MGDAADQRLRAELREKFLRALSIVSGSKASLTICDGTEVTANVAAIHSSFSDVVLRDMELPKGKIIDDTVISSSEIAYLSVKVKERKKDFIIASAE